MLRPLSKFHFPRGWKPVLNIHHPFFVLLDPQGGIHSKKFGVLPYLGDLFRPLYIAGEGKK